MAINVNGAGGNGRRSRGVQPLAEINVTPFVDVALVLLIIFMITAHVMEYGIEIDVPKTKTTATSTKDLPIVNVSKTGETYLGKNPVNISRLGDAIRAAYPGQTAVYLRADGQTQWQFVASVVSVLGEAHFAVNEVTQLDDNIGKRR